MDDFGVLVQTYGIRPQGKSAPMAASKTASRTQNYSSVNVDPFFGTSQSTHSSNSANGSILGDQNDVFGFGFNQKPQNYSSGDVFDDVLQMPTKNSSGRLDFDMEAMFKGSMNLNAKSSDVDDNVIWGFSGNVGSKGDVGGGDLLSSDPVDDFLGTLGNLGRGSSLRLNENKGSNVDGDDLIPGFGSTSSTNVRAQASSTKKSSGVSSIDELEDFGLGKMKKPAERAQASSTEKKSSSSSLDELEDFGSFMMKKKANGNLNAFKVKNEPKKTFKAKPVETNFIDVDIEGSFGGNSTNQENVASVNQNMFETEATDLDSFFGAHSQKSKPVPEKTTTSKKTEDIPDLFSGASFNTKKKVSPGNSHDDFSMLFGASPTSTQFEEIEGESEDRRRARLEHFQATQARMAQALAELNEREFRAQQEQEERHRIADAMEIEMKRWAAGKEGNLRALLSSLQQVLAPELGWKPVTLTDLITSSQVKIAYKKAALCVHPDKVQQKGASLQQKYVAEKIFDLLKEAWNKFNSEELQ